MLSDCEDCVRAVRRLHSFLDKELSKEDVEEVQYHLDACPPCRAKFRFEESVRKLVRVKTRNEKAPPALRQKIAFMLGQTTPQPDLQSNA